jgi:hypothetical protein
MINKDKLLILFSVTLILSTIIIWYSNINKKSISNCFTTTTLSDEDANNIVSEYSDKRYYYETEQIIEKLSL